MTRTANERLCLAPVQQPFAPPAAAGHETAPRHTRRAADRCREGPAANALTDRPLGGCPSILRSACPTSSGTLLDGFPMAKQRLRDGRAEVGDGLRIARAKARRHPRHDPVAAQPSHGLVSWPTTCPPRASNALRRLGSWFQVEIDELRKRLRPNVSNRTVAFPIAASSSSRPLSSTSTNCSSSSATRAIRASQLALLRAGKPSEDLVNGLVPDLDERGRRGLISPVTAALERFRSASRIKWSSSKTPLA